MREHNPKTFIINKSEIILIPSQIVLIFFCIGLFFSCTKIQREAKVVTKGYSGVTTTTATVTGDIIDLGNGVIDHGFCWSLSSNPSKNNMYMPLGTALATGPYTSVLQDLQPGQVYYLSAYVETDNGTIYGNEISFNSNMELCILDLISPANHEVVDNGCNIGTDVTTWFFDWSDCPGASSYNLYVKAPNSSTPFIDSYLAVSELEAPDVGNQLDYNIVGWTWKVRAFVNNEWGDWSGEGTFNMEPINTDCSIMKVNDIDGNEYNIINIDTMVWMAENLKTTKYNDGSNIQLITDNTAWSNLTTQGYCWYNNDATTFKDIYGALYNWYAIDESSNGGKNICPVGWRVPSDREWTKLSNYLGTSVAGGKMKSTGTIEEGTGLWYSPNVGATNETGFTAVPGGYRNDNGTFYFIGSSGNWWSSTGYSSTSAWGRIMGFNTSIFFQEDFGMLSGLSVRCIKD